MPSKVWICLSRDVIYAVFDNEAAARAWVYDTKWKCNMDSAVIEKEVSTEFKSPVEKL